MSSSNYKLYGIPTEVKHCFLLHIYSTFTGQHLIILPFHKGGTGFKGKESLQKFTESSKPEVCICFSLSQENMLYSGADFSDTRAQKQPS
jgi:hypothetical protein